MNRILLVLSVAISISCNSFAINIDEQNIGVGANEPDQINNIIAAAMPLDNDINILHGFENLENNIPLNAGENLNMIENIVNQNQINILNNINANNVWMNLNMINNNEI